MPKSNGKAATARIDKRVEQFIAVRDKIEEIEEEHKKQLEPFRDLKDQLIGEMLQFLDDTGQKSAKTAAGIATVIVRHTAVCSDPDAFIEFVREHDAYELIDRRANATACRTYAEKTTALCRPASNSTQNAP